MGEFKELYSNPEYYDIAFRRPVDAEVDFMFELFKRHSERELGSILEIACGPAYHARAFAARGVKAFALDLEQKVVDFAQAEASREGVSVEFTAADMRQFKIPQQVDLALTMYDGIDVLITTDELLQHLEAVAGSLNPGGLYLMEHLYPHDVNIWNYPPLKFSGERDGVAVEITYGTNNPVVDPVTQAVDVTTKMRVSTANGSHVVVSQAKERVITVQEMVALARCSGRLKLHGVWGDFDFDVPFDRAPAARRMIIVLEKTV